MSYQTDIQVVSDFSDILYTISCDPMWSEHSGMIDYTRGIVNNLVDIMRGGE